MKKTSFLLVLSALMSVLALSSCSSYYLQDTSSSASTVHFSASGAEEGTGFYFTVESSSSRATFQSSDVSYYKLSVTETLNEKTNTESYTMEILPGSTVYYNGSVGGTYAVTLDAYDSSDSKIGTGSAEVTIEEAGYVAVTIYITAETYSSDTANKIHIGAKWSSDVYGKTFNVLVSETEQQYAKIDFDENETDVLYTLYDVDGNTEAQYNARFEASVLEDNSDIQYTITLNSVNYYKVDGSNANTYANRKTLLTNKTVTYTYDQLGTGTEYSNSEAKTGADTSVKYTEKNNKTVENIAGHTFSYSEWSFGTTEYRWEFGKDNTVVYSIITTPLFGKSSTVSASGTYTDYGTYFVCDFTSGTDNNSILSDCQKNYGWKKLVYETAGSVFCLYQ